MKKALFLLGMFAFGSLSAQTMYTSAIQTLVTLDASSNYVNPVAKWTDDLSVMFIKKNA